MFAVFEKRGDDARMRWVARHAEPVAGLADYWRRCATVRTKGAGLVIFRPPRGFEGAIPPGTFRTDRGREPFGREREPARARLWADDCPGDWAEKPADGGEVRALVRATGLTQGAIAERLGVTDRVLRYWQSGDEARPIGWLEWAALRRLLLRHLGRPDALPLRPEGCEQPDDHREPVGSVYDVAN
jgi:hypothetical protein